MFTIVTARSVTKGDSCKPFSLMNMPMDHASSFACREVTERVVIVMHIVHSRATVLVMVHCSGSPAGYMLQDVSSKYSLHGYTCRALLRTYFTVCVFMSAKFSVRGIFVAFPDIQPPMVLSVERVEEIFTSKFRSCCLVVLFMSSFDSHTEKLTFLNTSVLGVSCHAPEHTWCSVLVHVHGTQMALERRLHEQCGGRIV